ncbi:hypothetical protein F0L68_39555 [Solihabitans fulvus]|uniref:Uncharacterized protein n=1 Tax=Solihabitans fulvus TaxID=1892852 RepID=A0A5B2WEJ2_9PSEU|nr:hypothetical protein [Solihabitans fulvus]KAA2248876.1 hypothetical protein F0L68_39555 [Solihabitans fulvus]
MTTPPNQPPQPGPYGPPQGFPPPAGQPGQQPGFPPPGQSGFQQAPAPGRSGFQDAPPQPGFQQAPGQPGPMPGQPGFGPMPGQGGFAPAPVAPGPQSGNKSKVIRIVAAVVVLVLIGGGFYLYNKTSPSAAGPGDCIKVNSVSTNNASVDKIDCGSSEAAFKVAIKLDNASGNCPNDNYIAYMQSGGRGNSKFTLCLALNGKVGDCFKAEDAGLSTKVTKVACSSGTLKVAKVNDGKADESLCDQGQEPVTYPTPPQTICIEKA